MSEAEKCVCCGATIPKGRQVCIICGYKINKPDLVEVVRCKDCKYWDEKVFDPVFRLKYGKCKCEHWENYNSYYETNETDFCSYGERKKEV